MIPKKIHYCWFGRGDMPKLAIKCIASWKKYCPDYEIIEWNEDNFNIWANQYAREAYQNKKYAFVSDYVRLFVLYNYGGIYMDVDVEVVKPLDGFLHHKAFAGFELPEYIGTCILASEKNFELFGELLDQYEIKRFINENGSLDTTTNVYYITNYFKRYGLIRNGQYQVIMGLAIYPTDYFCPYDDPTGILHKTENTATIHWFDKSWIDSKAKIRSKLTRPFHRIFGVECFKWLKDLIEPGTKK